jgi:hypothetical protein
VRLGVSLVNGIVLEVLRRLDYRVHYVQSQTTGRDSCLSDNENGCEKDQELGKQTHGVSDFSSTNHSMQRHKYAHMHIVANSLHLCFADHAAWPQTFIMMCAKV